MWVLEGLWGWVQLQTLGHVRRSVRAAEAAAAKGGSGRTGGGDQGEDEDDASAPSEEELAVMRAAAADMAASLVGTVAAVAWQFLLMLHLSGVGVVSYSVALLPLAANEVLKVLRNLRKAKASSTLLAELDVLSGSGHAGASAVEDAAAADIKARFETELEVRKQSRRSAILGTLRLFGTLSVMLALLMDGGDVKAVSWWVVCTPFWVMFGAEVIVDCFDARAQFLAAAAVPDADQEQAAQVSKATPFVHLRAPPDPSGPPYCPCHHPTPPVTAHPS